MVSQRERRGRKRGGGGKKPPFLNKGEGREGEGGEGKGGDRKDKIHSLKGPPKNIPTWEEG